MVAFLRKRFTSIQRSIARRPGGSGLPRPRRRYRLARRFDNDFKTLACLASVLTRRQSSACVCGTLLRTPKRRLTTDGGSRSLQGSRTVRQRQNTKNPHRDCPSNGGRHSNLRMEMMAFEPTIALIANEIDAR